MIEDNYVAAPKTLDEVILAFIFYSLVFGVILYTFLTIGAETVANEILFFLPIKFRLPITNFLVYLILGYGYFTKVINSIIEYFRDW